MEQPTKMDFIDKYQKVYHDCTLNIERWRVWYGNEFYIHYTRKEITKGEWSYGHNPERKHRWFVTISMIDEHRYELDLVEILDQLRFQTLAEQQ